MPNVTIAGGISEQAGLTLVVEVVINGATVIDAFSIPVAGDNSFAYTHTMVEGDNLFNLTAIDQAGNSGSVSATVTLDTAPPPAVDPVNVTVSQPDATGLVTITGAAGSAPAGSTITITNTVTGATITVVVNADGSFTGVIAGNGGDTVTITNTNAGGNTGTGTNVVVPIPPTVLITSPVSSVNVKRPAIILGVTAGTAAIDPASIAIAANALPLTAPCVVDIAGTGYTCTPAVNMVDGAYSLSITVADINGLASVPAVGTFSIDTVAPVVTIAVPANGSLTNQTTTSISGSLGETSTVTVSLGATDIPTTVTGLNYASDTTATLAEGSNVISVIATDTAGNSASATSTITLDTTPPAIILPGNITISTPVNGEVTVTGAIGSAEPGSTITITNTVTGATITVIVNADGSFSAVIAGNGGDAIAIGATDGAGNANTNTNVVVPIPPAVVITSPVNGSFINNSLPSIVLGITSGTSVVDPASISITNNGAVFNATCQTTVVTTCTPATALGEGLNNLSVTVADIDGLVSAPAGTGFTVDTIAPVVTLTSPLGGTVTNNHAVTFGGSLSEIATLSLTADVTNGGAPVSNTYQVPVANNSFAYAHTMGEGSNAFTMTATDLAGNSSSLSLAILLDTVPPTQIVASNIIVSTPVNGQITVTGAIGSAEPGSTVTITNTTTGLSVTVTANADGSFTAVIAGNGGDAIAITNTDGAGNAGTGTNVVVPIPPVVVITSPVSSVNVKRPAILLNMTAGTAAINPASITITANALPLTAPCVVDIAGTGYTCTPAVNMVDGAYSLSVTVADINGLASAPAVGAFSIDTVAPVVTIAVPTDGSLTNQTTTSISGSVSETSTVTVSLGATDIPTTVTGLNYASDTTATLVEGSNVISVTATDTAGNSASATSTITLDTTPPAIILPGNITISTPVNGEVTVTGAIGSAEPGSTITITNTVTGATVTVTVNADGSFSATIAAGYGEALTITPSDSAGNNGGSTDVTTPTDPGLPPVIVPSAIDPTVATRMYDATSFIYSGPNAVQTGVAPGTIEARRVAVMRGKVITRAGDPLPGVSVTIKDHPEYGATLTRDDGMFDMAVNGGGYLTVQYKLADYLPVQRKVDTPWRDYIWAPDVAMIQLDPNVTTIDLTQPVMQSAQGSVMTDVDGTRQATILFPAGTTASITLPDGTIKQLTTLTVRPTEYTVGPNGPVAMPGELPPTSGYTYAIELATEEAINEGVKIDGRDVTFNQPVSMYVDNFINIPVGEKVPVGFYNNDKSIWEASEDGRVIQVLSITNGIADLDIDGTGIPATPTALTALGITDAERTELATLYTPGKSLWRATMSHFSSGDLNWPLICRIIGCEPATDNDPDKDPTDPDHCDVNGSTIECQNQTLGETLGVNGAPYSLNYRSDRVKGRKSAYKINIPITDATTPPGLIRVDLKVVVAGQNHSYSFSPTPSQNYEFTWDGLDVYGREVQGQMGIHMYVTYVYEAAYQRSGNGGTDARSFGTVSGVSIGGSRARGGEITLGRSWSDVIGGFRQLKSSGGIGAWSLSANHAYDPSTQTIYFGDGTRRSGVVDSNQIITTIVGTGVRGYSGDGGPAKDAQINNQIFTGMAVASDGSLYFTDYYNGRVRKVDPGGIITTVAGTGAAGYAGDGGSATLATIYRPRDVAFGPDDSLYITEGNRIRKVDTDGIISTFYTGQGTLRNINVANNGTVYVEWNSLLGFANITKISPQGVAGYLGVGSTRLYVTNAEPADDETLYFIYAGNVFKTTQKLCPHCATTIVPGSTTITDPVSGVPAINSTVRYPRSLSLGTDGSLYILQQYDGLRVIRPDGKIYTIIGSNPAGFGGDGGPAYNGQLNSPFDIEVGPDGAVFIADTTNARIRRVGPAMPGFSITDISITSKDGSSIYRFDYSGRHLQTLNSTTGAVIHDFAYNTDGLLISITDGDGNVTSIERDGAGNPVAIVAPFGQRTVLGLDGNGYLNSVTDPLGAVHTMAYTADGLMTSFTDPKGSASTFTWDADGRLLTDTNAMGGGWTLSRTGDAYDNTVTATTAEGRARTYRTRTLPTGEISRTNVDSAGNISQSSRDYDAGSRSSTSPDGTISTIQMGPDPRFGMQSPIMESYTSTTPGGLTSTTTSSRTATLSDPYDPLSLTRQIDTRTINGRAYTTDYNATTQTITSSSPMGRSSSSVIDVQGRVFEQFISGRHACGDRVRFVWAAQCRHARHADDQF